LDDNQITDSLIETFGEDRVKELMKAGDKSKTKEVKTRRKRAKKK